MGSSTSQALQAALQEIEQQYEAAEQFVQKMQQDKSQISKYEKSAAYWKSRETYTTVTCGPHGIVNFHHHTDWHAVSEYNKCEAAIAAANNDMQAQADELKAKFGPIFSSIDTTIASLMTCLQQIISSGGSDDLVQGDLGDINSLIDKLFSAMKMEIRAALFEQEMQGKAGEQLSVSELAQLSQGEVQAQTAALSIFNSMVSQIKTLMNNFHTDKNNAEIDKAKYNPILVNLFGINGDKVVRDEEIIKNADLMENLLGSVLNTLAPITASLQPDFVAVVNTIERIVKEIKKILNDASLNPKAKQTEVLGLVMYILTFFQTIKQEVENQKTANNQDMSKGTIAASKTNVDDAIAQQKIKAELEANAKVMKIVMIVTEVVFGAILMATSGGIGAAAMAGLVTAFETMQTAGVFNATGALGDTKLGQVGADIVVGVTEALLTFGAGALTDRLAANAMKTAVKESVETAVKSAGQEIEEAAIKAAQTAGKAANAEQLEQSIALATPVLQQTAQKSAEKAAEKVMVQFLQQPFSVIVENLAKGSFTKTMQEAMEKAAQTAIKEGIEDAATIAKLAARGVVSSETVVEDIAVRAGNIGAAESLGQPVEKIADATAGWTTNRLLMMVVYGLMSNNLLTDGMKKLNASDVLTEIFQIIQMLLQMITLMVGSGSLTGTTIDQLMSKFPRYANLLSLLPQGVQAVGSAGTAQTYDAEAKAVTAIGKLDGESSLLNDFLQMLQKDATSWGNMVKKTEQDQADTDQLAGHMNDGEQAEINVLISSIG
ncbi:MAG: hypothetical protein K1X28_05600 [Parachlamydiales bacterium]|nr:hypothetical protein [Parachlamydiales bacterium]